MKSKLTDIFHMFWYETILHTTQTGVAQVKIGN